MVNHGYPWLTMSIHGEKWTSMVHHGYLWPSTDVPHFLVALVANFLQNRPEIEVELRSHCDARGPDWYNQKLSERRASSAARYLKDLGVAPNQVHPVGVGEGELRNECGNGVPCSEAKHQENRRTEFLIVSTSNPDD